MAALYLPDNERDMRRGVSIETLLEALDGALYVRFLADVGLVVVWYGSASVDIVSAETGEALDCCTNDAAPDPRDPARAQAMRSYIEETVIPRILAGEEGDE